MNMTNIWSTLRHPVEPLTRVNVVHFNDIHENTDNIDSFITGRDEFYKSHPNDTNLTLAAGDMFNRFPQNERIVSNFIKDYVDASATGNRDLEKGKRFSKAMQKYGIEDKFIGTNVYYDGENKLKNQILNTKIVNGVGLIGLAPVDFKIRIKKASNKNIKTQPLDETINIIRQEVKNMESKGINKIFILAHTGELSGHEPNEPHDIDYYKELSKIGGIDVIIGGHDHKKTDRWETTERGEPVKIVSTGWSNNEKFGANLDSFGEMSLVFDKKGVLKQELCKNEFHKTNEFEQSDYTTQFPQYWINWGKLTEKTVTNFYKMKNKLFN